MQFRYATVLDWFMYILGSVLAMAHGASIPLLAYLFGELIRLFIGQYVTTTYLAPSDIDPAIFFPVSTPNVPFNEFSNSSSLCSKLFPIYGITFSGAANLLFPNDPVFNLGNCSYLLTNTSTFGDIVPGCYSSDVRCLGDADFITEMNLLAAVFVSIAVGILICGTLQFALFEVIGERQTLKMQLRFFASLLVQKIKYFDIDDSGEYSAKVIG